MAILPILTAPDPRLKAVSKPVERVDDGLRALMDDMLETMYAAPGIGLAAIQVGVAKRLIVLDIAPEGEPRDPQVFVNPEVVWTSDERTTYEEGCLSVPEQFADVVRPAEAKIRFLDREGAAREIHAVGMLATCIQHEIDHLNGVLFVDRISALKRGMILRKLSKTKRQEATAR